MKTNKLLLSALIALLTCNTAVAQTTCPNPVNLVGLTVSKGILTPAFHPDVTNYTVMLPCDVYSLSIVPTPAAGNSISHINSTGGTVTLTTATKQTATVRSTAASGYKDYSITIICGFPTSIVYQTVNVMMSVNDNPNVNGGFTFEKPYQWTKNGHPISGATLWYLYLGDGLKPYLTDDMYNVEMTTNGQTYTLCSGVKFIKLVDN